MNKQSYPFDYDVVSDMLENWITNQVVQNPCFNHRASDQEKKLFDAQLKNIFSELLTYPTNLSTYYSKLAHHKLNNQGICIVGYKDIARPEIISSGNPPHFIGILPLDNYMVRPIPPKSYFECIYDISYLAFNYGLCRKINDETNIYSKRTRTFDEVSSTINFGVEKSKLFLNLTEFLEDKYPNFVIPDRYKLINN
jgi:hypothetical protein